MITIKKPPKTEYTISIRLTKEQEAQLADLADKHETSKNKVIQALIEEEYKREF